MVFDERNVGKDQKSICRCKNEYDTYKSNKLALKAFFLLFYFNLFAFVGFYIFSLRLMSFSGDIRFAVNPGPMLSV